MKAVNFELYCAWLLKGLSTSDDQRRRSLRPATIISGRVSRWL